MTKKEKQNDRLLKSKNFNDCQLTIMRPAKQLLKIKNKIEKLTEKS